MTNPKRLKKVLLRPLHKLRLDVDAEGALAPVLLRLEPGAEPLVVAEVERVDDRLAEVWFDLLLTSGERLTVRLERETLRAEVHTVETPHPERWPSWSELQRGG
ncbi:MAG: hypothetical protein KDD82_31100 [Planctomycetes bacterium]|nr:hypothetical protein [Planctomycetota bacterium]